MECRKNKTQNYLGRENRPRVESSMDVRNSTSRNDMRETIGNRSYRNERGNFPTQMKTFKAIYYWEAGLKQLLNEAPNGYIKRCIQDRLNDFSVTVKNLNVVGWSYSKEITSNTIHRFDVDALEKALQEEKVFVDICKPLIFNHYKRMGMESVKTTYQKIEKMMDMIETYRRENDDKKTISIPNAVSKGKEKDTADVIHSYLKIIGTSLGLIAASATALKAYNDIKEMTKKK